MSDFNAFQHPALYAQLGIDLNALGVVMLDVDPLVGISDALAASGCTPYRAPEGGSFWVDGAVGERTAHLTLLYGLLPEGMKLREDVLAQWSPEPIVLEEIEVFPFDGYACIVARASTTPNLTEAHARLSLLPHIDLFPEYKPHVTLAYVQGDAAQVTDFVARLQHLTHQTLTPRGLNFG